MATNKQRKLRAQKLTHRQRRQGKRLKAKRDRQVVHAELEMRSIDIPTPQEIPDNPPGIENPDCTGCSHPASAHRGSLCDECGAPPPARAKCPSCGFSHKVRKDSTMSRHDVYHGAEPTQCAGTGQPWNAAASPA